MCMRVQSPLAQQISQQSAMYSRSFFKSCAAKRFDGSAASCYLVSQRRSLVTSARFNSLFDQVKYLRTSIACHRFCSNEALENSSRLLSFPIIWKAPLDSREICDFWPYLFLDWDQREKKPNGFDRNQRPTPTFTFMFSSKLDFQIATIIKTAISFKSVQLSYPTRKGLAIRTSILAPEFLFMLNRSDSCGKLRT